MDSELAGLPGSSTDPGMGPADDACFEAFLDDAAALGSDGRAPDDGQLATAVRAHREHRTAWYADLVGALLLPASAAGALRAAIEPGDLGLRVVLVADAPDARDGLAVLRAARNTLADDDRVELVGVRLALPDRGDLAAAARALLDVLDFSVPAWIEVPRLDGWERALEIVAGDGAENVTTRLGAGAESFIRRAVDLDLTLRIIGPSEALLAGLCAVRAALNGAEDGELAQILGTGDGPLLASAVRRMSSADASVARAFLAGIDAPSVAAAAESLLNLGLVAGMVDVDGASGAGRARKIGG